MCYVGRLEVTQGKNGTLIRRVTGEVRQQAFKGNPLNMACGTAAYVSAYVVVSHSDGNLPPDFLFPSNQETLSHLAVHDAEIKIAVASHQKRAKMSRSARVSGFHLS